MLQVSVIFHNLLRTVECTGAVSHRSVPVTSRQRHCHIYPHPRRCTQSRHGQANGDKVALAVNLLNETANQRSARSHGQPAPKVAPNSSAAVCCAAFWQTEETGGAVPQNRDGIRPLPKVAGVSSCSFSRGSATRGSRSGLIRYSAINGTWDPLLTAWLVRTIQGIRCQAQPRFGVDKPFRPRASSCHTQRKVQRHEWQGENVLAADRACSHSDCQGDTACCEAGKPTPTVLVPTNVTILIQGVTMALAGS